LFQERVPFAEAIFHSSFRMMQSDPVMYAAGQKTFLAEFVQRDHEEEEDGTPCPGLNDALVRRSLVHALYGWVKHSLLCEIFRVERKMIVEITVNSRSFHSGKAIELSGQGDDLNQCFLLPHQKVAHRLHGHAKDISRRSHQHTQ
jgi:hypothetical protein